MAEDWLADVRRYASDADETVVNKIVSYLGIALRNRDSSLVSFSDPEEVGRVRERFLRKKLALTSPDSDLNEGLDWVKNLMTGDRTKNRVTVYYLLAHYFGKLDHFGGSGGTSAASLVGAAGGLGAAKIADLSEIETASDGGTRAPVRRAEPIPFPQSATSTSAETPPALSGSTSRAPQAAFGGRMDSDSSTSSRAPQGAVLNDDDDDDEGSAWPRWLTWLLVALAIVALFFLLRGCIADRPASTTELAASDTATSTDGTLTTDAVPDTAIGPSSAVPTGAGVVSAVRDNKPTLTVYFESGKSDVSNNFSAAAAALTDYLNSNPSAKLAVSGYNDSSGNAALNAELSKKRAQAVASALRAAGIPAGAIDLVKPAETTSASVTAEQARRVEVTVR